MRHYGQKCALWSASPSCCQGRGSSCPPPPLLLPACLCRHHTNAPLGQGLEPIDRLEPEDLLLEVGGQQHQVEELGDPGAGEPVLAGKRGAVLDLAADRDISMAVLVSSIAGPVL